MQHSRGDIATSPPFPGPGPVQNGPWSLSHHCFQAHFPLPTHSLLIERKAERVYLGREQRTEAWHTTWCSPRGTYLFFVTFKLVHPKVLHPSRCYLGSGVSPGTSTCEPRWTPGLSAAWWTVLVVLGALVNNATGNRSCDHPQSVCPSTLTLQGWAAMAVLSHWRSIISWYFWEESGHPCCQWHLLFLGEINSAQRCC